MAIKDNLADILARIETARKAAVKPAPCTSLIAVTKTVPTPRVVEALDAGQRLFGENRVQEALDKFPPLQERFPDLQLHLIGPLQTNKVADAVALFAVIQTLDRVKLADALARQRDKSGRCPRLFLQVNTGEEAQKSGVGPKQAADLAGYVRALGLGLEGLMCIPPQAQDAALHFALLAKLAADLGLAHLSMGMSADFALAVKFGATHVRVGSAIFASREAQPPSQPMTM